MKNLICPVSNERIPENLPRITAFFVLSSLALYVYTQFVPVIALLAIDFIARGFGFNRYSIFNRLSVWAIGLLGTKGQNIDKGPKIFAARLGALFSGIILLFHFLGYENFSAVIAGMLFVLSTLECVAGFCVGCYVYTIFIVPLYQKHKL
ncbi:MAG: DUF4395 domain-containing protein [Bacteroidales bacterium]|nr:DUF4395 domain-containing protein [Bacteroidales bacterium]